MLQPFYDACSAKVPTKKFTTLLEERGLQNDFENAKSLPDLGSGAEPAGPRGPPQPGLGCQHQVGGLGTPAVCRQRVAAPTLN